jgi:hypothetical protein
MPDWRPMPPLGPTRPGPYRPTDEPCLVGALACGDRPRPTASALNSNRPDRADLLRTPTVGGLIHEGEVRTRPPDPDLGCWARPAAESLVQETEDAELFPYPGTGTCSPDSGVGDCDDQAAAS